MKPDLGKNLAMDIKDKLAYTGITAVIEILMISLFFIAWIHVHVSDMCKKVLKFFFDRW